MPKLTKKLISNDVPSKIYFKRKIALHLHPVLLKTYLEHWLMIITPV